MGKTPHTTYDLPPTGVARGNQQMNSLDRVRTVLAGGIPDRVPVCLHNFMLAAREARVRMED